MRLIKGSLAGLVLACIMAFAPTAFARGGGGHGGGGGHSGGFAGHSFAAHAGAHFAAHDWHGGHYGYRGGYGYWGGGPFWGWYGNPGWYDPYYGNYDYDEGDYSDAQTSGAEVAGSEQTIVAVQKELKKLGYYDGSIDGIAGPETRKAISWFQSVDKLSVSGRIDDPTLKALQIS